jgi:hypothetical protein
MEATSLVSSVSIFGGLIVSVCGYHTTLWRAVVYPLGLLSLSHSTHCASPGRTSGTWADVTLDAQAVASI